LEKKSPFDNPELIMVRPRSNEVSEYYGITGRFYDVSALNI
jgi:hypothetical protein